MDTEIAESGQEVIRVGDHFYVLAQASRADDRTRVLKDGDTFSVMDRYGDILADRMGDQGLYHEGARHLSRLDLLVGGLRPLLLSSSLDRDNLVLVVDLTNPDMSRGGQIVAPRGSVHILRTALIWEGTLHERLTLRNYGLKPVELLLTLRVRADFADIFEVRGVPRKEPGCMLGPRVEGGGVVIEYVGSDRVQRATRVVCEPAPARATADSMEFDAALGPGQELTIQVAARCSKEDGDYDRALAAVRARARKLEERECEVKTSSEAFNQWVSRSMADLRLMVSATEWGDYPYAGVPWFSTPFGRDGAITALETLWVDPRIARGVLGFMGAKQADTTDAARDAEPGKIFHEFRQGEMAATGQVPYSRYYGSVDATPLYVMLAGEYLRTTGDVGLVKELWPSLVKALDWIDKHGDLDGDGFVEYRCSSPQGLTNQGWKDSNDSIFHEDGSLAVGPIALCEVQGYVYAAKRGAAEIAAAVGDAPAAKRLGEEAGALRERFVERFWDEKLGMYVLALCGDKRPCRVAASNAGHCLYTGIAREEHAARITEGLMSERFFSGWGVRTVATDQSRYNPMSYHNGTIWPHDTAMAAAGMARYGRPEATARLMSAMLDASLFAELYRLPELFCGFPRRPGEGPIRYPVACAPQSWAAGAVFMMLGACLGLSIDPRRREVQLVNPTLPEFMHHVRLRNLKVGEGRVDLVVQRKGDDLGINVLKREGGVRVVLSH